MGNAFDINKQYAENALAKRSMFQRDFTLFLMYAKLQDDQTKLTQIGTLASSVGNAGFIDLVWGLSKYIAAQNIGHSLRKLSQAVDSAELSILHLGATIFSLIKFVYRLSSFLLTLVGSLVLFPVNMAYGALDWLGLQGALAYFQRSTHNNPIEKLNRATYVSLAISILTLPIRLAFGLVEALQEPLHLYDFWVKGAVDAHQERKNHEISRSVYAGKLFLHAFKVVCTLGAVLTIVGITAIPFISKGFDYLGKIAYGFIDAKNLIPYHKYIFDMPLKGLEHTLVGVEKGIESVTGIHHSYASEHTNAKDAIKLGFESSLTKGAGLFPMEDGYKPTDLKPGL